ncbi:MAG: tetratricopeptide repeat protein, partial [Candidatus Hodarchaeales archaeon]
MPPRIKETKDPDKLVRSGIFALNNKKWKKAVRKFEVALKDEEMQNNAIVWANYGIALTNLKKLSEALSAFSIAVDLDKKNEAFWSKKGLVEYQLELYREAGRSFSRAKKLNKSNDEIPILISRSLQKQGELKKAIKALESSRKSYPDSAKIPIELARIWEEQGELEKTLSVLEKALKETNHPDPGLLLGQLLLDNQEYTKAIEIYLLVLERFPESYHAQYGIGVAYHAKKDYQKALDNYRSVITNYQTTKPPQSLYINIARVLREMRRPKEAIDALFRAKKLGKPSLEIF